MLAEGTFVAYHRVSSDRQDRFGLGLDAQRKPFELMLSVRAAAGFGSSTPSVQRFPSAEDEL